MQGDERTPLIRSRVELTPLPTRQLFILTLLMITQPLMSLSILPYINEVCYSFLFWSLLKYDLIVD
jgi:hypothetical protein